MDDFYMELHLRSSLGSHLEPQNPSFMAAVTRLLFKAYKPQESILGWRPLLLGWRPLLLGWRPFLQSHMHRRIAVCYGPGEPWPF